jgi:hypothetical protein
MAKKGNCLPLESWAAVVEAAVEQVKAAWDDLQCRGLAAAKGSKFTVSPWAMRRANSPVQRRLAAHLAGFLLTEDSFIVRRAGREHAGIILVPQHHISSRTRRCEVRDRLLRFLNCYPADELHNQLWWLPQN